MTFPTTLKNNNFLPKTTTINSNEEFLGIDISSFSHLSLSSATNLSIGNPSGIVATTDNVSGSGYLTLPETIDRTKKWRFATKFELNDARAITIQICDPTVDFKSGVKIIASLTSITTTIGGVTQLNQFGFNVIPIGSKFWLTVVSDGVKVTTAIFIENPTSASNTSTFQDSNYQKLVYKTDNYNLLNGAWEVFSNLSRVHITSLSTLNKIHSIFVNIGSFVGSFESNSPGVLVTTVLNDPSCWLLIPGSYGNKKTDLCFVHHPSGNPGDITNQPNSFETSVTLWNNNFIVCGMSGYYGTPSTYLEATLSNWGAPVGLYYRKNFIDWIRTNLPLSGSLVHLGFSMGLLNALNYSSIYKNSSKGIVGISGVTDLADSYSNRGFSTHIQKGFGTWYVCIQAGTGQNPSSSPTFWTQISLDKGKPADSYYSSPYIWRDIYAAGTAYSVNDIVFLSNSGGVSTYQDYDPNISFRKLKNIPIYLRHGDTDATIPLTQMTVFRDKLLAAGYSIETETISGGTHLGASMYSPQSILTFFNSCV